MTSGFILPILGALWAWGLAVFVLLRGSGRWERWSLAASLVVLGAEGLLVQFSANESSVGMVTSELRLRFALLSAVPVCWLLFGLTYSRGDFRESLVSWRIPLIASAAVPVLALFGWAGLVLVSPSAADPTIAVLRLGWAARAINLALVIAAVLTLMNLERTFRASVGTMRWRIKYAVLGLGALYAVRLFTSSQMILYSGIYPLLEYLNTGALLLACALCSVALHRTGRLAVELYPSKATIYGSITVLLAGAYLFIVGVLAKLAALFGGDSALPFKSFLILAALAACAAFALSDRLRLRTKRFISRQFKRPTYDYSKVWRSFTERTASSRDQATLGRETVRTISETMDCLSVALWRIDEREGTLSFGASTSLTAESARDLLKPVGDVPRLVTELRQRREPFVIDPAATSMAGLAFLSPIQFEEGGRPLAVPLRVREQLLGLLIVADRVGGLDYSVEDLDLLKCMGAQTAGSLLELRLSEELIRSRQLEAFQQMAAFFVHDLKNTASALSLMLQNLPAQFDNPAFREDALRAVGKAVGRLDDLIRRLSSLRQGAGSNLRDADLNEVVEAGLSTVAEATNGCLKRTLRPLPRTPLDPDQIQKVVVNLVLNAKEAMNGPGEITVETEARDGWVVLSVRDNGCGISPDFIRTSLFRPFQTTKRNGIGIGMFHCKSIVDAHRGRIEVQSEPGQGTLVRVWLPT